MKKPIKWVVAAGVAVVAVVAGGGAVMAGNADDDAQLTGEQRERAVASARAHVGEGEVTDTEVGDDGAAYGVEIRKPDRTQVEVNLDRDYKVTGTEADDDSGPGDDADEADDAAERDDD